jgi:putative two-component system response regulator
MDSGANFTNSARIMIIAETAASLQVLSEILTKSGYIPEPVSNPDLALKLAKLDPPDLIVLDLDLPNMDGYWAYQQLKVSERMQDIPLLFIDALADTHGKSIPLASEAVGCLARPFIPEQVNEYIEAHLKFGHLLRELARQSDCLQVIADEQVKDIIETQMAMIYNMAHLSESREDHSGKHLQRTCALSRLLAGSLAKHPDYQAEVDSQFVESISRVSPLHDIGKISVPASILLKPGKLTPHEFEIMKKHTIIGFQALEPVRRKCPQNYFIKMACEIIRSHHEKWDGSGYPDGLAGEDIPLAARIMAIVDVYDALRARRVYKSSFSHDESCRIIHEGSETHFDPRLLVTFKQISSEFNDAWEKMQDLCNYDGAQLFQPVLSQPLAAG